MQFASLYGSYEVLDAYLSGGLRHLAQPASLHWQHGWIPRLSAPDPDLIIGEGGWAQFQRSHIFLVAREDQASALVNLGFARAFAFGLPFAYALKLYEQSQTRIAGSLLVLPADHYTPEDGSSGPQSDDSYIASLSQIQPNFSRVTVCFHGEDFARGRHKPWTSAGFDVIQGASPGDPSSLMKLANLFLQYEFCTTNGFGSHIAYGAASGCKISIWGPASNPRKNIYEVSLYRNRPDLVSVVREHLEHVAERLGDLGIYCNPRDAVEHSEWGLGEIGYQHILPPGRVVAFLEKVFRENPLGLLGRLRRLRFIQSRAENLIAFSDKITNRVREIRNYARHSWAVSKLSTSKAGKSRILLRADNFVRLLLPGTKIRKLTFLDNRGGVFFRPWRDDVVSLKELFSRQPWSKLQQPGVLRIVDVGAEEGYFSIMLSTLFPLAQIDALEPFEDRLDVLRKQARLVPKITPIKVAVGVRAGAGSVVGGRASKLGPKIVPAALAGYETVEIISLVDLLAQAKFKNGVDILRLNLAGIEYEVLRDCASILAKKVGTLIIKFHYLEWKVNKFLEIQELFASLGFSLSFSIESYHVFKFESTHD